MAKAKTSTQQVLTVHSRAVMGKRPVARLRQEGLVPGIVYGHNMKPLPVAVNRRELGRLLHSKAGEHALVTLHMEDLPAAPGEPGSRAAQAGGHAWEKPALVKALQHDPVDGHVTHIDFHTILLTERIKVKVAVALKGEPIGVKQEGGILEHFLREVEVECLPAEIPTQLELDVNALKIGDTVHVSDLVPPEDTRITNDPQGVVASVQKPREEKPEEAATAVAEPEVIREKKEEGEAPAGGETGKAEAPEKKDAKS